MKWFSLALLRVHFFFLCPLPACWMPKSDPTFCSPHLPLLSQLPCWLRGMSKKFYFDPMMWWGILCPWPFQIQVANMKVVLESLQTWHSMSWSGSTSLAVSGSWKSSLLWASFIISCPDWSIFVIGLGWLPMALPQRVQMQYMNSHAMSFCQ